MTTIGILGGGQLGYMLALAGYPLGLHFRFLDPSPEAPVGRIAHRVTAEFMDEQALDKFAHGLEVVDKDYKSVYDLEGEVFRHCPASNMLTAFAVVSDDGSFYKLDDAGNTQVTSLDAYLQR